MSFKCTSHIHYGEKWHEPSAFFHTFCDYRMCVYVCLGVCKRYRKRNRRIPTRGKQAKRKVPRGTKQKPDNKKTKERKGRKTTVRQSNEKKKETEESVKERVGDGHKKDQVI